MSRDDDREIVPAMQRALAGRVGAETHAVWFGRGVRMEPCGTTLRIAAADRFRLDYLRRAFRTDLVEAVRAVAGSEWALEFVCDPTLGGGTNTGGAPPAVENAADTIPLATSAAGAGPRLTVPSRGPPVGQARAAVPAEPPPVRPGRAFARLDDFVTGEANRVAWASASTAAARPGAYTPFTIVGPCGSGKTHLLEGIWRGAREARRVTRALYLSAEQFTNQYLEALHQSGMPLFRRKVREAELLLIDDVQFFANKQSTVTELIHTFDTLHRAGKQLVFAADRPLDVLKGIGNELITRLKGGLVCTLEPADYSTRLAILRQLATKHALAAPHDVLAWLAGQLGGDARHLAGAIHRLRAESAARERRIDMEFAQETLDDVIHAGQRPVRLADIVAAVADVFDVPPSDLQSGGKRASVTMPRMLTMFLARKWTRAAHSEIGRTLGRKSHSTVVSAQQKVTAWLAGGKVVALGRGQCRLEDAIKRVESQLRLA